MRLGTHLQLTWTKSSPKTSPTSGQTERIALLAQFSFRYSPIFSSVFFNRLSPCLKVKYQESRGGSRVEPYIQEINCCCHPGLWLELGVSLDPSSHIRIISQLLQTRRMKQLNSSWEMWKNPPQKTAILDVSHSVSQMHTHEVKTHSRVCPQRSLASLQMLWRRVCVVRL